MHTVRHDGAFAKEAGRFIDIGIGTLVGKEFGDPANLVLVFAQMRLHECAGLLCNLTGSLH